MLTLKEYRDQVDPLLKLESQYRSNLNRIKKKLEKIRCKHSCVCNICKNVFDKKELGYKKYLVRDISTVSKPMGDYDQKQTETIQHILCCPVCGRIFNEVIYKEIVWTSNTYSRYDDTERNFKYPLKCKKLQSKEIFKQ